MNGIRKIGSKKGKGEYDFIYICGTLIVSFLIFLAMPCFFLLSNERLTPERSYASTLFQPSKENMVVKKLSNYSAALALAKVGIERAVWELNHGNISNWQGNSQVRRMTIFSFRGANGKVLGDIEIKVEKPEGDNPVVESTGRVTYTDSLLGSQKARILLQRPARVILEKNGHRGYQLMESN